MIDATFFEWMGTGAGILGAAMISSKTRFSPYGWIAFIISSTNLSVFALMTQAYGLFTLELVFIVTNVVGLWRWLISPYIQRYRSQEKEG